MCGNSKGVHGLLGQGLGLRKKWDLSVGRGCEEISGCRVGAFQEH